MKIRMDELLNSIGGALDAVEGELLGASKNHGKRIACLSASMARYLRLDEDDVFAVAASALLHDNALTEYILSERPGPKQEVNLLSHCEFGERNIKLLPFKVKMDGYVLYHHERPDGKGPYGLTEEEIPLGAAIIAAADMVDAETHLQFLSEEKLQDLLESIQNRTGTMFTKQGAEALLRVLTQEMLLSLRDENIEETYKVQMPEWSVDLQDEAIMSLAQLVSQIIDYKSEFTRNHSVNIASIAWRMGRYYQLDEDQCYKLYLAASLHDLGKLWIPTEILEKPGKLTDEEFDTIKKHINYSYEMLSGITGFENIFNCAVNHHEKLDGSGYPLGLDASQLDSSARLMTCIDIYQAISEKRPYHPERDHSETIEIMNDMVLKGLIDGEIVADMDVELARVCVEELSIPPLQRKSYAGQVPICEDNE